MDLLLRKGAVTSVVGPMSVSYHYPRVQCHLLPRVSGDLSGADVEI